MLTSYNGVSITYDDIGNPLSYYNGSSYNFTWTGRQLTGVTKGGITYSFTYNDEGIRTSKTKGGVTTTYYLEGSRIVAEKTGDNLTVYIYDSSGMPVGMQYCANSSTSTLWDVYWFERNLQGDVVAVYSENGTKLVQYKYDAWGKISITYYSGGSSTTATKNPFRYRGYYYDVDLGLYYLQTRYYDANTGRFISPDTESVITATPDALTDKNLYAYCDNNPVMRRDDGGEFWLTAMLVGAVIGATINATVSAISQKITTGTVNWGEVLVSAGAGALSGAVATTGIGAFGSAFVNAAIDGTEYLVSQTINGGEINGTEFVYTMFCGAVTAGKGIDSSKLRGVYKHSKETLKTAVSPTKIARYATKIRNVKIEVAKGIGSVVKDGAISTFHNWMYDKFR